MAMTMNSQTLSLDDTLQQAVAQHRAGQLAEAEQLYRDLLKAAPQHPEANHNLGIVLAQRGQAALAVPHFKTALDADRTKGNYWLSYARGLLFAGQADAALKLLEEGRSHGLAGAAFDALLDQVQSRRTPESTNAQDAYAAALQHHQAGRLDQAIALYRQVLARAADHIEAHEGLGNALAGQGQFEEAAACFRHILALRPDNAGAFFELGDILTAQGKSDEAITAYRRAIAIWPDFAEAHYHLGSVLSETGHVAEGFAHYMRRAELMYGPDAPPREPPKKPEPLHKTRHDQEQRDYLNAMGKGPITKDTFHIGEGSRLAGPAVNPANVTPELMETWRNSWPQMVVIENFLTPEALDKLRRYCAESTIWRKVYSAGYIGAAPEDGFACPLLAQIVEEIHSTYGEILGPHLFHYLGAFKYDSELSTGTNTHADNSAVNVNFYIVPDEANLNPENGGMEIWDVVMPPDINMNIYNGDEAAARAFLKKSGAKSTIVPHRANRAVIFKSDLFHKTDDCQFANGYLNKRINVSLLYGVRGAATK